MHILTGKASKGNVRRTLPFLSGFIVTMQLKHKLAEAISTRMVSGHKSGLKVLYRKMRRYLETKVSELMVAAMVWKTVMETLLKRLIVSILIWHWFIHARDVKDMARSRLWRSKVLKPLKALSITTNWFWHF